MLKLVLPKGSLEKSTLELFEGADLGVRRSSSVDYRATIDDPRVDDVRILRPQEIPTYVADGLFDLGITGRDWIEETGSDVVSLGELHYSKATARPVRIVVAVPGDSDVESVADLPAGVRVSSEYPELTRRFFVDHGVDDSFIPLTVPPRENPFADVKTWRLVVFVLLIREFALRPQRRQRSFSLEFHRELLLVIVTVLLVGSPR